MPEDIGKAEDVKEVKDSREAKDVGESGEAMRIAEILLTATALPDAQIFPELGLARYTKVDYYRMACHLLFQCMRCGNCCTTGDPIRLRQEDAAAIARHLKIPLNKALKKYTTADPDRPDSLKFKHILPCKFYDRSGKGCKIYSARPWSCRIFPFLGIYGNEDQVVVNQSCPGSVQTMKALTDALQSLTAGKAGGQADAPKPDPVEVKRAKILLREALNSF